MLQDPRFLEPTYNDDFIKQKHFPKIGHNSRHQEEGTRDNKSLDVEEGIIDSRSLAAEAETTDSKCLAAEAGTIGNRRLSRIPELEDSRRLAWETGIPDYNGIDKFENIMKKLNQSMKQI